MAVSERTWRADPVPADRRDAGQAPPPPAVREVLALQRGAGNQAVTRLLADRGSPRAAIQRTPTTWAADQRAQAVVTLKKGKALTSWWPAIVRLTSGYGQLADHDRASRATTLTRLEAAIAEWRTHQQSAWVKNTKLVGDKKTALTALEQLIAAERQELQHALRPPATVPSTAASGSSSATTGPTPAPGPSSATTGPPAPMRGMPLPSSSLAIPSRGGDAPRWFEEEAPQEDVFHLDLGDESFSEEPEVLETDKTVEKEKPKPVESNEKDEDDEDGFESESEEAGPEIKLPEMPAGVHVQVHLTQKAYLPGIRAEGLIPGKRQGIGDPDTRKPDPGNIYVIDEEIQAPALSAISMEAGGQPVVVLAASPGSRDVNYRQGAVTHAWGAPPVRTAAEAEEERARGYSFTLPMTPRSRAGLTKYINDRINGGNVTPDVAEAMVVKRLDAMIPLHMLGYHKAVREQKRKAHT